MNLDEICEKVGVLSFENTWVHQQFYGVSHSHSFSFLCGIHFYLSSFSFSCPMSPVSLDCPFLIALSIFTNVN